MVKRDVEACCMFAHPSNILVDIGCIDNKEEIILSHLVHKQVVNCSAVGIEHHTIIYLTRARVRNVVREDMINIAFSIWASNTNLAHVRDIKNATSLSYSIVFLND